MQDTERLVNNIDKDLEQNGFRRWLIYLKILVQKGASLPCKTVEKIRDLIYENYIKEEQ